MRNLILTFIFLCAGISLNAQDLPEIVYLKNGNLIRGRIVKLVPNETLEIKSGDGKIYVYRMNEVIRIERNLAAPQTVDTDTDVNTDVDSDVDTAYIEPTPTPRKQTVPDKQRQVRTQRSYDDDDVYNRRPHNTNRNYNNHLENNKEAAFSAGIKGGMNLSTLGGKGVDGLDPKIGFNVGIFMEYTLPSDVYFLSGFEFTMKGAKYKEGRYKETANPIYLQLPIHIGYKTMHANNISLGIHAGPYFAYGIGGKIKAENGSQKEEIDFFGGEGEGAKSFDFGLGTGIDLDINRFRIGIGYDFGLNNIGRNSDSSVRNQNVYVQVGCKF